MLIIQKILKYFLFFLLGISILLIIPDTKLNFDDQILTTISFCTLYLLFELFSPSYTIFYQKKKIDSK